MSSPASFPRSARIRFGPFELDLRAGELFGGDLNGGEGSCQRLQERPLAVLLALLEQPGEVVSRDELRRKLWPDLEYGDFDHALDNAVHRLRGALGDSAAQPRYVETVPRRGYRFVAPVERSPIPRRRTRGRALAAGLAAGLTLTLAAMTLRDRAPVDSISPAAHEALLKARHHLRTKTADGLLHSRTHFEQALTLAPDWGEAWAGLAQTLHFSGAMGLIPKDEAYRRTQEAVQRALAADRSLAEAWTIRAESLFRFAPEADRDPTEIESTFRRALDLDPGSAEAHHRYGMWLASRHRLVEGLAELERARRLDPLDPHTLVDRAALLYENGRREEALTSLQELEELTPFFPKTQLVLGAIHCLEGEPERALAAYRRAIELSPDTPKILLAAARAAVTLGDAETARDLTLRLHALEDRRAVDAQALASLEKDLGDLAAASG